MMGSDATRTKWDKRYRDSHQHAVAVARVLLDYAALLPAEGVALDLACGLGGNALYLAARGLEVHAWDISPVAIDSLNHHAKQQGLTLHTAVLDVVAMPPRAGSFDVIIVSRFLQRELCPAIATALKPGGLLLYQTFTCEKRSGSGPNNPHFLLEADELPHLFNMLEPIHYSTGEEALFVGRAT